MIILFYVYSEAKDFIATVAGYSSVGMRARGAQAVLRRRAGLGSHRAIDRAYRRHVHLQSSMMYGALQPIGMARYKKTVHA